MSDPKHIVVAGAGILGASIAWHLATQGAKVTVIDKTGPAAGASGRSFGWINATYAKRPYRYHVLSRLGVKAWREVANRLPVAVQWGGSLAWSHTPTGVATQLHDAALQAAWGSPAQVLGPVEMAELEPHIDFHQAPHGGFSPQDGWVDAAAATRVLLAAAQAAGARCQFPTELIGSVHANGRLLGVATSHGDIAANQLVVACGTNSEVMQHAAATAAPQQSSAGIIITSKPLPPTISHVLAAHGVLVQQRSDGRLIMGAAQPLEFPLDGAQDAAQDGAQDNAQISAQISAAAARITESVSQFLPGINHEVTESVTLGWRPMPQDGFPAIGRSPQRDGVYVAVTHSGVTLAIILGRLIALEILQNLRIELLTPYRPERFAQVGAS